MFQFYSLEKEDCQGFKLKTWLQSMLNNPEAAHRKHCKKDIHVANQKLWFTKQHANGTKHQTLTNENFNGCSDESARLQH